MFYYYFIFIFIITICNLLFSLILYYLLLIKLLLISSVILLFKTSQSIFIIFLDNSYLIQLFRSKIVLYFFDLNNCFVFNEYSLERTSSVYYLQKTVIEIKK